MKKIISTNPAKNFIKVGEVLVSSPREIRDKVKSANQAKLSWKGLGLAKRIKLITPLLGELQKNRNDFINLITQEMGKPIKESKIEFEESLSDLEWFLANGQKYLQDEITIQNKTIINKMIYEPYGTAAVILPWNFPLEMIIWGVIPNLIAGNVVIMKHSEQCPLIGKLFNKMIEKINLGKGVFSQIYGDGKVGGLLVNEEVDLIWFTGSSNVGKHLFDIAGKKFIKSVMELGGSNPAIIFSDANIEESVKRIYTKRFINCGQICNAAKRLIVHKSVFKETVLKLEDMLITKIVGNPEDPKSDIGSLVSKKQLEILKEQVNDAVKKGANIIIGGKLPINLKGAYYLPTILTNINRNMKVWNEEVFGPVLPVITFETDKEAIELANDTQYGLGAYIFTKNQKRFLQVASQIDAGGVYWNNASRTNFDPFGGYKHSGMGRELGRIGLQELCQIKSILMNK